MKQRIFCSDVPEAKEIIKECVERITERDRCRQELLDKYGAIGFIALENGEGRPVSLIMKESTNVNWLTFERKSKGGHFIYSPRRNTKKGKELFEEFQNEKLGFCFSCHIVKKCNAEHTAYDGRMIYYSIGWFKGDKLYLKIPDDDYFPKIPSWFSEVTKGYEKRIDS